MPGKKGMPTGGMTCNYCRFDCNSPDHKNRSALPHWDFCSYCDGKERLDLDELDTVRLGAAVVEQACMDVSYAKEESVRVEALTWLARYAKTFYFSLIDGWKPAKRRK